MGLGLKHKILKFSLYFKDRIEYWRLLTETEKLHLKIQSKTGPFFGMNIKDRLFDGHYYNFDSVGLPVKKINGDYKYNYTTIFSFALANWQLYLETGNDEFTLPLLKALNYAKENNVKTDYGGVILPYNNMPCSMNQGECLSVIARVYELTGDQSLIDYANQIIRPFTYDIEDFGVCSYVDKKKENVWYEEYTLLPIKHVLNGMNYSLMGLWDIYRVMPQLEIANKLWIRGINSLENSLHQFDVKYWSWYWVSESTPNYISSIMYHNLHICQLRYLANLSNSQILSEYSELFEKYHKSYLSRIRAGIKLLNIKIKRT